MGSTSDKSILYYDSKLEGLSIIVTKTGLKTFSIRRRDKNKKDRRYLIGRFPLFSVTKARKTAIEIIARIQEQKNPFIDNSVTESKSITFKDIFDKFIEEYAKEEKKTWQHDEAEINKHVKHWFNRKATSISKQDVIRLQKIVTKNSGKVHANRLLERIKAIYNKASYWDIIHYNPVKGVKFHKEISRDRFMQTNEIPKFLKAVSEEHNRSVQDFIMISLLTGVRKSNALKLKWSDLNLEAETPYWYLIYKEAKNEYSQTISLIPTVIEILKSRQNLQKSLGIESKYVFEGSGKDGHYKDPKKGWKRIMDKANIIDLHIHDLRRTLASYLNRVEANPFIISAILGHRNKGVTEIYARTNLEMQKEAIERAWDKIQSYTQNIEYWW